MKKEDLEMVFKYLEKEMNKQGLFYFTVDDGFQILAHLKCNDKVFATFYTKRIIKILRQWENDRK